MKAKEARKICERFALKHKLIFDDEGECGFGRECVGFLSKSGNWLDFNPCTSDGDYRSIEELRCEAVEPPPDIHNYHKHECMAVLGRGDSAIIELATWVNKIELAGNVRIVEYQTGAKGIQAMISGIIGYAIVAGKSGE